MKLKTTTCDIEIEDKLDRDGELEIMLERIGCQDIIIYLNAEYAYIRLESAAYLFETILSERDAIDAELAKVKTERDALKARLDGGIRVCVDETKKTASYFYFPSSSWHRANATLIADEGVKL